MRRLSSQNSDMTSRESTPRSPKKSGTPEPSRRNSGTSPPDCNLGAGEPAGQSWDHYFLDCPRRHGTADDDAVVPGRRCHELYCRDDVVDGSPYVERVRGAACSRRRPDTYKRDVGSVESTEVRRRGMQGATGDGWLNKRVPTRLGHRTAAAANVIKPWLHPRRCPRRRDPAMLGRPPLPSRYSQDQLPQLSSTPQLDSCPGPMLRP